MVQSVGGGQSTSVEIYLAHREQLGIPLSHLLFSFRHLKHAKNAADVEFKGMISLLDCESDVLRVLRALVYFSAVFSAF